MPKYSFIGALSLATVLCTQATTAQSPGFYFGAALGQTQLDSPTDHYFAKASSPLRTLLGGYAWRQDFRAEARLSYLKASQTDRTPLEQFPRGPIRIRLNAFLVEANGGWSPRALRLGRVQPVLSAGVVVAHIVEGLESDTPEETTLEMKEGAVGSFGLETYLNQRITLTGRTSYRMIDGPVKFPADGFGIRGASWEVGLRITP